MNNEALLPCIAVKAGDINPRVITCGDPARAERISQMLTDAKCMAKNREYWTYNGLYKGIPITVTSHGVGAAGPLLV